MPYNLKYNQYKGPLVLIVLGFVVGAICNTLSSEALPLLSKQNLPNTQKGSESQKASLLKPSSSKTPLKNDIDHRLKQQASRIPATVGEIETLETVSFKTGKPASATNQSEKTDTAKKPFPSESASQTPENNSQASESAPDNLFDLSAPSLNKPSSNKKEAVLKRAEPSVHKRALIQTAPIQTASIQTEEEEEEAFDEALIRRLQQLSKMLNGDGPLRPNHSINYGTLKASRGFSPLIAAQVGLLAKPMQTLVVSSRYGWRETRMHHGMDFAANEGTPIYASSDGVVVHSDWAGGYGNMVYISHSGGLSTLYGHCSKMVVMVGQHVRRGQLIAYVGNTGHSTGPHLHYEVHTNGNPRNPEAFLFR